MREIILIFRRASDNYIFGVNSLTTAGLGAAPLFAVTHRHPHPGEARSLFTLPQVIESGFAIR